MKRMKKKQIQNYIKRHRKLLILCAIALVVLAAMITAIILYMKSDRIGAALNAKNFEQVQIKKELLITTEVYTDSSDTTENTSTYTQATELSLQKDGDIIYEENGTDKYYFYTRDGQNYVLYYDTQFGMAETGEWVEIEADGSYWNPAFDFSVLSTLDDDYLKKDGDYYSPKNNAEDIFFQILHVSQPELHTDCNIKFKFEKGKLIEIRATYTFDGDRPMEEIYTFTYENTKVKLPKIEAAN